MNVKCTDFLYFKNGARCHFRDDYSKYISLGADSSDDASELANSWVGRMLSPCLLISVVVELCACSMSTDFCCSSKLTDVEMCGWISEESPSILVSSCVKGNEVVKV